MEGRLVAAAAAISVLVARLSRKMGRNGVRQTLPAARVAVHRARSRERAHETFAGQVALAHVARNGEVNVVVHSRGPTQNLAVVDHALLPRLQVVAKNAAVGIQAKTPCSRNPEQKETLAAAAALLAHVRTVATLRSCADSQARVGAQKASALNEPLLVVHVQQHHLARPAWRNKHVQAVSWRHVVLRLVVVGEERLSSAAAREAGLSRAFIQHLRLERDVVVHGGHGAGFGHQSIAV